MPKSQALTVGERILIHLSSFLPYKDAFEVPQDLCQDGIAVAVGIGRAHAAIELKNLRNSGEVYETMAHVKNAKLRKKVYFLNEKGLNRATAIKNFLYDKNVILKDETGKSEQVLGKFAVSFLNKKFGLSELEALRSIASNETLDLNRLNLNKVIDRQKEVRVGDSIPTVKNFFGREKELESLRNWLDARGTQNFIIITGLAGIGKTTLASKITSEYKDIKKLFWCRLHEWDDPKNTIQLISNFLLVNGKKRLKNFLESMENPQLKEISYILENDLQNLDTIFVFDDYHKSQNHDPIFSMLLELTERTQNLKIILTSRYIPKFYNRADVNLKRTVAELSLFGLDLENCKKLLATRDVEVTESKLTNLYRLTKGHPLSLELIDISFDEDSQPNFARYMYEEIYSKLDDNEKKFIETASVYRYPVRLDIFLQSDSINYEMVREAIHKSFAQEFQDGSFEVHELIKEFFYKRMNETVRIQAHRTAGEYYLSKKGEHALLEAQYHFIKAGDWEKAIRIAIENGWDLIKKGHLQDFKVILAELPFEKIHSEEKLEILNLMGEIARLSGDWDLALKEFNKIVDLSEKLVSPCKMLEAYLKIGLIYTNRSEWSLARKHIEKALKLARKVRDKVGLQKSYKGLGIIYRREQRYKKALDYLFRSLKIRKETAELTDIVDTYTELGSVYQQKGELNKAIECYNKCLELLSEEENLYEKAKVYHNLGIVYFDKSNWNEALEYFGLAKKLAERLGDVRTLAYTIANIGRVYIEKLDFNNASLCLEKALEILEMLGDKYRISIVHSDYGLLYRHKKDWTDSIKHYKECIKILKKLEVPYDLAQGYYELAAAYECKGDTTNFRKYKGMALNTLKPLGLDRKEALKKIHKTSK